MNWVGGSRNRLVMKNDSKRQKEFFEKRKMQQKLKHMGLALPAAPPGASSASMDLVTLFVVNQIAAKKESRDPPKVGVVGGSNGRSRHKGHESLVLPMSPCSPSQLSLAESQPQYSAQGTRQRMNAIPQGFRFRQLSPVLESAFSDNSASDYLPPTDDPLSSFSSTSSASSAQGIFPLQVNRQRSLNKAQPMLHRSSPSWDPLDQTKFQPFMTDEKLWSVASNQHHYQRETRTAAQILFGNQEPSETEVSDHSSPEGRLSFNLPADKEPMLEMLEKEQQFKEDVFRGFCSEEYERGGRSISKIYLRHETPNKLATQQTVPDSEGGVEFSSSTYTYLSGSGHKTGPVSSCEHLPSYSCREGYLSSDSNDEEECCQRCLNTSPSSCINQACCDTPRDKEDKQGKARARWNLRGEQKLMDSEVCLRTARGADGSSEADCSSPCPLTPTQSCGLCKCKKTLSDTREAGTQTVATVETCNSSTQCDDAEFSLCFPPVNVSVQLPATVRHTNTAAQPNSPQACSGNWDGGKGLHRGGQSKDHSLSGSGAMQNSSTVTAERPYVVP